MKSIKVVLSEILEAYRDTRIAHCQLKVFKLQESTCLLSGSVLDAATLAAVMDRLEVRFPAIQFNKSRIEVLRQTPPQWLCVGTNLTGVYTGPSFSSEMVSQVLNGQVLELLREVGSWAYVRQEDGYLGWVYRPYLTQSTLLTPTHIVCTPTSLMRCKPEDEAMLVGRLLGGTFVHQTAAMTGWAGIALANGDSGWVHEENLRSIYCFPEGGTELRAKLVQDGYRFIGVPYLWGGCSSLGIDCSGLTQLLYRMIGVILPRDADMQFKVGRLVQDRLQPGDLLFFGSQEKGDRAVSHVAMSLGNWEILHSSRANNGVYAETISPGSWLHDNFMGARTFLAPKNEE